MQNGNTSAFPVRVETPYGSGLLAIEGLTKREYFAAQALQGLLSKKIEGLSTKQKAQLAVKYSDALLKELEEYKE